MKRLEYKFGVKIVLMITSAGECQTVSFNASDFCPQDEIEQVILVGGSTRVPKVQEVLLKAVGK